MPDTLDLRRLLTALYEEQVAGFFDPDSGTLFVFEGSDVESPQFKFVLAHEMVHALQSDYLPLDSIMHQRFDSDRLSAAQAVLEGQATLASMKMMAPGQDLLSDDAIWETFREQLVTARGSMKVFAETPRVLQEGLIFPYLAGAEFVRWYERDRPDSGAALWPCPSRSPPNRCSIPSRYARGDYAARRGGRHRRCGTRGNGRARGDGGRGALGGPGRRRGGEHHGPDRLGRGPLPVVFDPGRARPWCG